MFVVKKKNKQRYGGGLAHTYLVYRVHTDTVEQWQFKSSLQPFEYSCLGKVFIGSLRIILKTQLLDH